MNIKCLFGFHSWDSIKCLSCGKARDVTEANSALIEAVSMRRSEKIKAALKNGADVNARNLIGQSAIHYAISTVYGKGGLEIAKLLLENGADVNAKDQFGFTPLAEASKMNHKIKYAKLLLDYGADVNAKYDSIHNSFFFNSSKDLLDAEGLKHLESINRVVGYTPLMFACMKSPSPGGVDLVDRMIQLLVDCGADVNAKTENGLTPLLLLLGNKHFRDEFTISGSVRYLLEKGADVNVIGMNGWTALDVAMEKGYTEIVKLLLDKGADKVSKTLDELSAIKMALRDSLNAASLVEKSQSLGFRVVKEDIMGLHMENDKAHFMLVVLSSNHPTNIATMVYMSKDTGDKTTLVDNGKCTF
jgi:ankyrin repeat protein